MRTRRLPIVPLPLLEQPSEYEQPFLQLPLPPPPPPPRIEEKMEEPRGVFIINSEEEEDYGSRVVILEL